MRLFLKLLLFAVLTSGCSHKAGLVVTGNTLLELEREFTLVADAMDAGVDAQVVTPDDYRAFREFGLRFQALYPAAVATWRTARKANDEALRGRLGGIVGSLFGELGVYLEAARQLGILKGATP